MHFNCASGAEIVWSPAASIYSLARLWATICSGGASSRLLYALPVGYCGIYALAVLYSPLYALVAARRASATIGSSCYMQWLFQEMHWTRSLSAFLLTGQ